MQAWLSCCFVKKYFRKAKFILKIKLLNTFASKDINEILGYLQYQPLQYFYFNQFSLPFTNGVHAHFTVHRLTKPDKLDQFPHKAHFKINNLFTAEKHAKTNTKYLHLKNTHTKWRQLKTAKTELSYEVNTLYTYATVELFSSWIEQFFAFVEETIDKERTMNKRSVFMFEVFPDLKIKDSWKTNRNVKRVTKCNSKCPAGTYYLRKAIFTCGDNQISR